MDRSTRWLQELNRRFRGYAIRNLMMYIVAGMGVVFLLDMILPFSLAEFLAFDKAAILRGQVWRLVTFIIMPPNSSLIFIFFSLYFYWLLGSVLEREWGSFKFNIFYLCGMVGTIIGGLITGFATNYYINMSLFFAFAILYPNFQLTLFFMLPIKVKYLAYFDAAYFVYMFIFNSWPGRIALLISLLNLALFFWRDAKFGIEQAIRRAKWKRMTGG